MVSHENVPQPRQWHAGEDKLEKAAKERAQSIWDIARHYTEAYWADIKALNIRQPAHWSVATDYIPQMIEFAKSTADEHCYELDSGLYFDTSTVADYGRLARAATEEGEGRIEAVEGKRITRTASRDPREWVSARALARSPRRSCVTTP